MLDMDTLVTGLAARTDEIRAACNSTVPNLYNPHMMARRYATLDHVADGRFVLGVAPGWIESEYEIAGADYDFGGVHVEDLGLEPKPVRDPHMPIRYAGSSYAAVRRAADFADEGLDYIRLDLNTHGLEDMEKLEERLVNFNDQVVEEL